MSSRRQSTVPTSAVLVLAQLQGYWWTKPYLRRLNFWIGVCVLSSYAAGYDGALIAGLLTIGPWFTAMGADTSNMVGLLAMTGLIGLAAGPWFGGWLSDRFERPRAISIAAALQMIGAGLTAISIPGNQVHQRTVWAVARVLISFASGASTTAAPALMTELSYPTHRPTTTALFWCGYYLGSVTAAWITFGCVGWESTWAWRLPCLLQMLAVAVQLPLSFFLPNSPRQLVVKGDRSRAAAILAKYHTPDGDIEAPLVRAQMAEIVSALTIDDQARNTNILELFRGRGNRRRLYILIILAIGSQWVGNGVVTYYLPEILASVGVKNLRQQAAFNGGIQVFNLVVASLAATQTERFGRRRLFLVSGFGMLISFTFITALSATYARTQSTAAGRGVIAFLFLFDMSYDIALSPLLIAYPSEILPYRFRTKGIALMLTIIACALTFNIWANPVALEHITWRLYLVYIPMNCVFILSVWLFFPETRGHSVEAVEAIFDGDRADIVATDVELFKQDRSRAESHVSSHQH